MRNVLAAIAQLTDDLESRYEKPAVAEVSAFLAANPSEVENLCSQVFRDGIPTDSSFFERLYRISNLLGFHDEAADVIGRVWASALRKLNEMERELLMRLLPDSGHSFFILLGAIPTVLTECRLQPQFCIELFFTLQTRIGNDLVRGGLWRGIDKWVSAFPDDAFCGLNCLLERNLDDGAIAIGAAILGGLRVSWERTSPDSLSREAAEELKSNPDVTKRLVYHRSWINVGWLRGISHEEFTASLARMSNGTAEERTEAFNFLRCLIADGRTQQESVTDGIQWLRINTHQALPDSSKHWVVRIVTTLGGESTSDEAMLDTLRSILIAAMPLPLAAKGTWTELEFFLVDLLHKSRPQFVVWLLALLDADAKGVIKQFSEYGKFEHLCSELLTHDAAHVIAREFFSVLRHRRQLAFTLFDEIPFAAFPNQLLSGLSDDEVALCLCEARLHHLTPENTLRFYAAFLARAEDSASPLADFFRNELLFQAKNFPGAVLDGLKAIVSSSKLVQKVIAEADLYFEKLRPTHHSAINSMEIPGWRRALSIRGRQQSKKIEAHTDEFSILKHLCTTSYLIYGDKGFRYCRDGEIGPLSQMQEMSVSMEIPRLAMIDPEGMVIRRRDTILLTKQLAEKIRKGNESTT
jgi:hypothetical protein